MTLRLRAVVVSVLVLATAPQCLVVQAARGHPGPDAAAVVPGASRDRVAATLGPPIRSSRSAAAFTYDVHRFDESRPGSWSVAADIALMDLLFAFFLETQPLYCGVTGTPGVATRRREAVVTYDAEGCVIGVFRVYDALPDDGRAPLESWPPPFGPGPGPDTE